MALKDVIRQLLRKKDPPVIMTQWGPVTEWARKQCVENMRADKQVYDRVKNIVVRQCGNNQELGELEFKRRFPELFE